MLNTNTKLESLNNLIEDTISKMHATLFFSNSYEYNGVFHVSLYNDDFRNDHWKITYNAVHEFKESFKMLNSDFIITDIDYDDEDDSEYVRFEFKVEEN